MQATYGLIAHWEATTDRKIADNAVNREYAKLREERQAALDSRREALAQKLFHEETAFQASLTCPRTCTARQRTHAVYKVPWWCVDYIAQ